MPENHPDAKQELPRPEAQNRTPFPEGAQEAELVHVLFVDLIGYSQLKVEKGTELVEELFRLVRETSEFKKANEGNQLRLLPSGDGTAIVFSRPAAPLRCALEIASAIKSNPQIKLRMGVNSGPVRHIKDIRGENVPAGAGINYAQRAMDCGEAGHILLTKATADFLLETNWADCIHDAGEFEVKHGKRIHLYNVFLNDLGNPEMPTHNRVRAPGLSEQQQISQPKPAPVPGPVASNPHVHLIQHFSFPRYGKLVGVVVSIAVFVAGGILLIPKLERPEKVQSIHPLTPLPGESVANPQISPDGKHLLYVQKIAGKSDIYLRDFDSDAGAITSARANLTKALPGDNIQPSFAPDGKIVFVSDRGVTFSADGRIVRGESGGLFILDPEELNSTGVLTQRGYNPAWSPDGKHIVYGMENIVRPEDRATTLSQIYAIAVVNGINRGETSLASAPSAYQGDAVQPAWSPHGKRLAVWFARNGRRDIATIRADGTDFVPITDDPFLDWDPAWSPDGYLYFASDRGGDGIHLWRVRVNENSGKKEEDPVEVPGCPEDLEYVNFSRDGRWMTFVQRKFSSDIYQASFDPISAKVDHPVPIISQGKASRPDVSPDGKFVAFNIAGMKSTDNISIVSTDLTKQITPLVNDDKMNRSPRWSPDGKEIAYWSNRKGGFQIFVQPVNGSGGVTQISPIQSPAESYIFPVWDPTGSYIAFTRLGNSPNEYQTFLRRQSDGMLTGLPKLGEPDQSFFAWSWSIDGQYLAGYRQRSDGKFIGISIYSVPDREFLPPLTTFGSDPVWLNDSRRILFLYKGAIYLVDSKRPDAGIRPILSVQDFGPEFEIGRRGFSLSHDNRTVYFSLQKTTTELNLARFDVPDKAKPNLFERIVSRITKK